MNQVLLNKIATNFLTSQSVEVASKLRDVLHEDAQERTDQIAGLPLHYIHNMALFDCLAYLNSFISLSIPAVDWYHSLIDYDFYAPVTGLNAFPKEDQPGQVNAVFQFYHLMVMIGMTMIALTLLASFLLWRKKLFDKKWLMVIFVFAALLPQIANQVGWFAANVRCAFKICSG